MESSGGVAVVSPASIATDAEDVMRPSISEMSPSSASDRQPTRSGRSVDSFGLQRRQASITQQLQRRGTESSVDSGAMRASKRPRSTALEKVWGWLAGGTLRGSQQQPASPAASAPTLKLRPQPQNPLQSQHLQQLQQSPLRHPQHGQVPQSTPLGSPVGSNMADIASPSATKFLGASAAAMAPVCRPVPAHNLHLCDPGDASAALAAALAQEAQPSRKLKRKSTASAAASPVAQQPPPDPEVDLECVMTAFNLDRSRVARLDHAALAQHDAALLEAAAHPPAGPAAAAAAGAAAAVESTRRTSGPAFPTFSAGSGGGGLTAAFGAAARQQAVSGGRSAGDAAIAMDPGSPSALPSSAAAAAAADGGGQSRRSADAATDALAVSAPPRLSPVAAAAAADAGSVGDSQRRRRSSHRER